MSEVVSSYNSGPRTLRLIFEYANDEIELVDQQSIEVMPFASEPLAPPESQEEKACQEERDWVGFWYESNVACQ